MFIVEIMETIPDPEALPATKGSYALVINLATDVMLPIDRLNKPEMLAGRYIYAGSANGPGGLRARLARHLKASKAIRWHVDYLTTVAGGDELAALPGANECAIVAALSSVDGVSFPHPGFGSSDCKNCRSHLLCVPPSVGAETVFDLMKAEGVIWRRPPPTV